MELTARQRAFLDLARSLLRLERSVEGVIDAALRGSLDLGLREVFVLAALDEGRQRPGSVAATLNLPPPSVTRAVEQLVGRGLVDRRRCGHDRRRVDLTLTAPGREVLKEARAVLSQALGDAWPDLHEDRAADLAEGLAELVHARRTDDG
jgi:DNA-binding MarR family transcriptional regulator